ncbi:hypothetical protein F0562_006794 [Nyssa sinensis]|uniref:Uncharacterized protein n=1 Tax=Nyssa sinensis TaxID=561372 RepID=A0A5J5AP28_9ASTE|nr:hypothetical protein F0562_006794 [Nyssa sinensis]
MRFRECGYYCSIDLQSFLLTGSLPSSPDAFRQTRNSNTSLVILRFSFCQQHKGFGWPKTLLHLHLEFGSNAFKAIFHRIPYR